MSTEPRRVTRPADWTAWENQVVNGRYPLRRFLASSRHSVVFLTEHNGVNAAIKLLQADPARTQAQLAQWRAAADIEHPNLIRLYDSGRAHLGGREILYVVMELAEQTLAEILTRRALGPEEVRDMLPPMLTALTFLHESHHVHGQLKPSNILAVGDQLKLSSEYIRPEGRTTSGVTRTSLYDPPELREGVVSPAGDIWAFGMALVEALSQRTWKGARGQGEATTSLLASLPDPFEDIARKCLSRLPTDRPTAAELEVQFRPTVEDAVLSGDVTLADDSSVAEQLDAMETPAANDGPQGARPVVYESYAALTLRALIFALLLFLGAWAFLRN